MGLLPLLALAWWPVHGSNTWLAHGFFAMALLFLAFPPVLALRIGLPILCLCTVLTWIP
ncbi:hypothetical protein PVT67_15135 [Gallaecimonas kandeliae]|uniref:hypothetical protein n=1 Tax=Gallaecimonas kandeliae TaxID=3029055 RepID=UPI0026494F00|nr:hypothetical protein [Gallaecimonas kandeliae]WKE64981.1 hypothetical protein PVT67_15135 [Gallaecimonas kandeliae]